MNIEKIHASTVLLIGGTSEIAMGIATALRDRGPLHVVLAARPGEHRERALDLLAGCGCTTDVVDFEATDHQGTVVAIDEVFDRWDVDVVVVAHGVLPDQHKLELDPARAGRVCTVNFSSAVVVGLQLALRMGSQGHGVIVALSSVAGIRPRRANYVYAAGKAGMDAFYTGLRDRLRGCGVRVLVIRPGHVFTRMTEGLAPAPFAVGPARVGQAVAAQVADGNRALWVPAILGPVMAVLRILPAPLFRRLTAEPGTVDPSVRDHLHSASNPEG